VVWLINGSAEMSVDRKPEMPSWRVTDGQVAALRAYLAQDPEEAARLNAQLGESRGWDGYGEFVWAAFVLAVRRRFAPEWTVPRIVQYVAAVRVRWAQDNDDFDPRAGEILMRCALDDNVPADLDEMTRGRAQLFLLGELVADEQPDNTERDKFLAMARMLADNWLSAADR
jgi:hypothetical protein